MLLKLRTLRARAGWAGCTTPPLGKSTVNDVALRTHTAPSTRACQAEEHGPLAGGGGGGVAADGRSDRAAQSPQPGGRRRRQQQQPLRAARRLRHPGASVAGASRCSCFATRSVGCAVGALDREGDRAAARAARVGDDARAGWDENGSISAASSWRPSSSTTSKAARQHGRAGGSGRTRRQASLRGGFRPSHTPSAISIANVMGPLDPSRHALVSHLSPLPQSSARATRSSAGSTPMAGRRRVRRTASVREDAAPLAQLTQKKLKLRSQAES